MLKDMNMNSKWYIGQKFLRNAAGDILTIISLDLNNRFAELSSSHSYSFTDSGTFYRDFDFIAERYTPFELLEIRNEEIT
jgi:hypothetical protein